MQKGLASNELVEDRFPKREDLVAPAELHVVRVLAELKAVELEEVEVGLERQQLAVRRISRGRGLLRGLELDGLLGHP